MVIKGQNEKRAIHDSVINVSILKLIWLILSQGGMVLFESRLENVYLAHLFSHHIHTVVNVRWCMRCES